MTATQFFISTPFGWLILSLIPFIILARLLPFLLVKKLNSLFDPQFMPLLNCRVFHWVPFKWLQRESRALFYANAITFKKINKQLYRWVYYRIEDYDFRSKVTVGTQRLCCLWSAWMFYAMFLAAIGLVYQIIDLL